MIAGKVPGLDAQEVLRGQGAVAALKVRNRASQSQEAAKVLHGPLAMAALNDRGESPRPRCAGGYPRPRGRGRIEGTKPRIAKPGSGEGSPRSLGHGRIE